MKYKSFTHFLWTLFIALSFALGASAQCTITSVAGSLSFTGYDFTTCSTITVTGYINDTDWGTIKTFLTNQGTAFSTGKVLDLSGATYTGTATGTTGVSTTYSATSPTANAAGAFTSVFNTTAYSLKLTGTVIIPNNITTFTGGIAYDTRVNLVGNNVTMLGQALYYYGYNDTNYTLDLAKMFPNLQYIIGSTAFEYSSTVKSIVFPVSFKFNDVNYTSRLNNAIDGTSGTNSDNVTSVTSITILNTATPALGASTDITATLARFQASTNTSTKVYVPTAQLAAYQALYPSSTYTKITFVAGSSTFQTAGNWSTASNWSDGIPDAGADAVIAAACTIDGAATAKNVTVNADASLTLGSGKSLSAKNLTLKSNASGNATLLNNGTITVSATTSVEQYLTSGRNWYISSPVSSGAMPTAGYAWNEASGAWATVGTGVAMTPGKGYIVPPAANGTVTFSGSLNNNITSATTLNRTTGATKEGFNLVGNPYPSYLNWNSITKTNLSTTMWYRTKEGSAYKFYTYNGTDAGYDDGVGVPAGVTNLIPPMQAFWVRVESGNATGTIGFENAARTHKDIAGNILKAPAATNRQIIRITVSNGENTDETLIYTNSNATSGIDKYDSPKMMNATAEVPDLYTIVGTEKLVINGLNTLPLDTPIPLGLAPGKAGAFSISANELTNIDSNTTTVILRDAQENVNFDLSTGQAYAFATDGTATENRFSLILRTKNGTTGIDLYPQNQGIKVYVNENNLLHVQLADEVEPNTLIQMYNVAGQQLYTIKPLTSAYTLSSRLQSGVYMVKIQHAGSIFTYKLVVK